MMRWTANIEFAGDYNPRINRKRAMREKIMRVKSD